MTMTNKEAIENLEYLISDDCTDHANDFVEEIEMAIEALKQPTAYNPDKIVGKMNKDEICKAVRKLCDENNEEFLFIIDGRSEWSVSNNEHIRNVANYHKNTEIEEGDKE